MFTKKEVTVLDENVFKTGYFLTYCVMILEDYGATVKEGMPINAIISSVEDMHISIILSSGEKRVINLEQLIDPDKPTFDSKITKVKVLGVKPNAINVIA